MPKFSFFIHFLKQVRFFLKFLDKVQFNLLKLFDFSQCHPAKNSSTRSRELSILANLMSFKNMISYNNGIFYQSRILISGH